MLGENPKPGRLYAVSEHGRKTLDWVDPETGEIIYECFSQKQGHLPRSTRQLDEVPVMFLEAKQRRNGYWLYDFLIYEKILQVILHEEQDFDDYFIQASS